MWRMSMSILVSGWILTTPALWVHRPEQAVLAGLVGVLGIVLSFAVVLRPRLAVAIFTLGAVRALSTFAFPDTFGTSVDNLTSGLLLVIAGMYPRMVVTRAASVRKEIEVRTVTAPPTRLAA
jgi:hypothetical protein